MCRLPHVMSGYPSSWLTSHSPTTQESPCSENSATEASFLSTSPPSWRNSSRMGYLIPNSRNTRSVCRTREEPFLSQLRCVTDRRRFSVLVEAERTERASSAGSLQNVRKNMPPPEPHS